MVRRIVALTVLFASSCGIAVAQSIAIDQSFGEQGIVRFPTSVSYDTIRYVQAISTLRDGSLAIVTSDLQDQFFSRLTYDGRFDARFGVNGTVRVPRTQFIEKVIDDSSDRLVTAGGYVDELRVARFNPDGRLDASFGTGGVATVRISTGEAAECKGLLVGVQQLYEQGDGRVLIFGTAQSYYLELPRSCIYVARLEPSGALDQEFGNAGVTETAVLGMSRLSSARILTDGSLELSGVTRPIESGNGDVPWQAAILRLDPKGNTGSSASVQVSPPLPGVLESLRNGIVITKYESESPTHETTIRVFQPDGTRDATFGGSGQVKIVLRTGDYMGYTRMADGGLVGTRSVVTSTSINTVLCVWRYSGGPIEGTPANCNQISIPGADLEGTHYLSSSDAVYFSGEIGMGSGIKQLVLARIDLSSPIVEFYHSGLKHYFMTPDGFEADALDRGGAGGGWSRTGVSFYAGGPSPMCRFYGTPGIGPNSHFYTPDAAECAGVKRDRGWLYEGLAFSATPASDGRCRSGLRPIHRLYNNRAAANDSNHRHIADFGLVPSMQAQGWVYEGVAFCAR